MSDPREQAHRLIDRMPETQLTAVVGLLEAIVDPVAAALRQRAQFQKRTPRPPPPA